MEVQKIIALFSKNNLTKKEREQIINIVRDKEYIEQIYKNEKYKNIREFTITPALFSKVLEFSFSDAKIIANKEYVKFSEITAALIKNKEINSLKKLEEIFPFTEDDIKSLFTREYLNNNSIISSIIRENLSLALDIFNHYKNSFSDTEYKEIDTNIKSQLADHLYSNTKNINSKALKIINNYPFCEINQKYYKESTWKLLLLSVTDEVISNNKLNKFKNTCHSFKIPEEDIPEFLHYAIFNFKSRSNFSDIKCLDRILNIYIDSNLQMEGMLEPLIKSDNLDYKNSEFKYFIAEKLPLLIRYFDKNSFNNLYSSNFKEDIKNTVIFDMLLSDKFMSDLCAIPVEHKIHYINMIINKKQIIDYQPEKILLILKSTSSEDKLKIKDDINMNSFYIEHNYLHRKDDEKIKQNSFRLMNFLVNNQLHPNLNLKHIQTYYDFLIIEDEQVNKLLCQQKDNKLFFIPFIKQVVDSRKDQNLDFLNFYKKRENFIKDFSEDTSFVDQIVSLLNSRDKEYIFHIINPLLEMHTISESLKTADDNQKQVKKRL